MGCYYMIAFTDFQPDLERRYQIGDYFVYVLFAMIVFNFRQIASEVVSVLVRIWRKRKHRRMWDQNV